jgi:hypothetical protein
VAGFFEPQARRYSFRSSLFRHAAILRGKSVSVNSAFTSFRGDKSALEISVHQRQSAVSASARFRLHLISTRRAGATIKFLAFSASLR